MLRQRDYPKQISAKDDIWEIKWVRTIDKGEVVPTLGLTDPSDHTVYMKMGQLPKERLVTFIHELIHIAEFAYGFEIPHDLVSKLDVALAEILIANYIGGKAS